MRKDAIILTDDCILSISQLLVVIKMNILLWNDQIQIEQVEIRIFWAVDTSLEHQE